MAKVKKWVGSFTTVPNALAFDKNLSWKAKGIFLYMQAKPSDWDFSSSRMAEDACDGKESTREGIRELIKFGYLTQVKLSTGRMEYELVEPEWEKPTQAKPHSGKTRPIRNKDIKQIKSLTNSTSETVVSQELSKAVSELIELFRLVNTDYKKFYANKTQRAIAQELVDINTLKKCINRVYLARFCYADKYFPNFISPFELQKKWPKVQKFYETKKNEKHFMNEFNLFVEKMEVERKPVSENTKRLEIEIGGRKLSYNVEVEKDGTH